MRVTKKSKYQNEREDICNRLLTILNLDEDHCLLLSELDSNIEKQTAIMNMKDEIQQYFAVSSITPFKPHLTTKRAYLNIVRGILRQQGYSFDGTNYIKKYENGLYLRTIQYKVIRNIENETIDNVFVNI